LDYLYAGTTDKLVSGDDEKNVISFISSGWNEMEFDPPSNALAVTVTTYDTGSGEMVDSDIYFNDEYYNWGHIDTVEEEDARAVADIQNIGSHEIGHFFGVDHPSEDPGEVNQDFRYATMYYSSGAGDTTRRSLNDDDMNAIRHLYPNEGTRQSTPEPEIHSVSPNSGHNTGPDVKVRIKGANFGPLTMVRLSHSDVRYDEVCKIVSLGSDWIDCVFDLYHVSRGEYDLVVSNLYDKSNSLGAGFKVFGEEYEDMKAGGCGRMDGAKMDRKNAIIGLIILIFPITLMFLRRRAFARARIIRKKDQLT